MRIVLGRRTLVDPGGTQTYAATVAYQLERLGHDVTLATEVAGPFAELVRARGTRVVHPDELRGDVDVILGHDVVMTATLAERYPDARVVFVSHSDSYDLQLPPLVPGVVDAVVACSERMASRVRASVLDAPIVRLREPIDSDAYFATAPLPPKPRRALILSNYLQGARRDRLVTAWEGAGIECVHVGTPGELMLDPRPEILGADIVVAKARAALEGMCCGRAVYVYDQFGGDGWITADNYAAFEADHFAGQATDTPVTLERLTADLADYSPDMGVVNHELVRTHHAARRHAIDLVEVLRGPHPGPADRVETLAELARLARATMRAELHAAEQDARAASAERELASAQREVVAWRDRATEA
ncbi:MAG TPA: hypothetical protein VJT68_01315, partial [Thermoleophilaceae bacterium]|nr:hypothetical protein [Thermoleophilaceae bacterium]